MINIGELLQDKDLYLEAFDNAVCEMNEAVGDDSWSDGEDHGKEGDASGAE